MLVLQNLNLNINWVFPPVGEAGLKSHGSEFPDEAKTIIDSADATLFGATSGPCTKALFYLRWGKQTYANIRPTRYTEGFRSPLAHPELVDFIIVRENLEDSYLWLEGNIEDLAPLNLTSRTASMKAHEMGPGKYAIKAITEAGSERVIRHSFELAASRALERSDSNREAKVTVGAKTNMLPQTDGLFAAIGKKVAKDFPNIRHETFIVDDLAHRLVAKAHEFDVVVMPNLYGDILSDAAAGLVGGLGLAPSACIGEDYAYFEPAHGTAPDIAGQGIVNPTATLMSAAMMLEYLAEKTDRPDYANAAALIEEAVDAGFEANALRPMEFGGDMGTNAVTAELISKVS
jgi:isocitrate/isopropylmalate dehydrogenase